MFLVTGATGTVGRHVVRELADRDEAVRVGLRTPTAAPKALSTTAEVVEFDFERPETWGSALEGVDRLFLMRPPRVDTATVGTFAAAAARTGAEHVVYLSGLGAGWNVLNPHHWSERRLRALDVDYTLLRGAYFMQNLFEVHGADVRENDAVFVPAGDGMMGFVDARDVGAVAATVLTESGHENRAYDVTGPDALDFADVARTLSEVLDREISYPDPSLVAFARRMRRRVSSPWYLLLLAGIYTTTRLGLASTVTRDAARILGREPRTLRTFVEDYADEFRP